MIKIAFTLNIPVSIKYSKEKCIEICFKKQTPINVGKAEIIKIGKDITIFAIGTTVYSAIIAAQILEKQGINAEIINCRFVKLLDSNKLLSSAISIKKVITVEDNVLIGGFGTTILELFEKNHIIGNKYYSTWNY